MKYLEDDNLSAFFIFKFKTTSAMSTISDISVCHNVSLTVLRQSCAVNVLVLPLYLPSPISSLLLFLQLFKRYRTLQWMSVKDKSM